MNRKLSFAIGDSPVQWKTHRIVDLCDYLTAKVLEPMFRREKASWNRKDMDFFTFDNTCDPLEPTGTILFRIPPYFAGRSVQLVSGIQEEFAKLKIKAGPLVYQRHPTTHEVLSIRIPIAENPTFDAAPPEVNMSQMRGYVVLRDLLGYQKVNGRYEFTAEDLIARVAGVTEERIAACTASPVKGSEGVRRAPSPASVKGVRRCLEEVRQFADWARKHNHRRLTAS
jgi:hypothetical protein